MAAGWLVGAGWRLLAQAALAALAAGAVAVAATSWWAGGRWAAIGAQAAGATLAFFALGHVVQVLCARFDARLLLVVSLITYVVQVLAVGALIQALPAPDSGRQWLFVAVAAVVLGWLTGLVRGFRRLRVPVFDSTADQG
ncbi:MAG: hypothetical protein LBK54_08520 [Propionibacteriaceae bacterium]|jgi:hypothetical protein|nr:hypothetical protein [Propionibacteriaceae bacterium]